MVKKEVILSVNGEGYSLALEPNVTLLQVIREEIGLTGTKIGCDRGDCGACIVLLDGDPVNSCLVLAVDAADKEITTIEGLKKNGTLHPIQKAFVEHGAIQCGYCTPGMVLAAKALLDANAQPTELQVREALAGNLCRCTGYVKIVEAVIAASRASIQGGGTQ
ncbi:MAG: (2Fe-2S)-binding protein [Chloroflexi bacterium]|nr:(2Fe-2S)-binding protein [Chloroflexota bacterium]